MCCAAVGARQEQEGEVGDVPAQLLQDDRRDSAVVDAEGRRRVLRQGEDVPARVPRPAQGRHRQVGPHDQIAQRSARPC